MRTPPPPFAADVITSALPWWETRAIVRPIPAAPSSTRSERTAGPDETEAPDEPEVPAADPAATMSLPSGWTIEQAGGDAVLRGSNGTWIVLPTDTMTRLRTVHPAFPDFLVAVRRTLYARP